MDQDEFAIWLDDTLSRFDRVDTLFAKSIKGMMPVGWVYSLAAGRRLVPHAVWADWASHRNKIEAGLAWFHGVRNERTRTGLPLRGVIETDAENKGFFDHLKRYGVAGGGFRIPDLSDKRTDSWFYYIRGYD